MTKLAILLTTALLCLSISPAFAGEVYIISPKTGEHVSSQFTVTFGLKGMGVAPAGVERSGTGHHHLLIDTDLPDLSYAVPSDPHHVHFGGGQTQANITLPPGEHTLQLLLADHNHLPHNPPIISEKITIIVVGEQ